MSPSEAQSPNPSSPRPATPRIGFMKKFVFMVVLLALFLGMIEGAARLFFADPHDSPLMIPVPGKKDEWKQSELHAGDPYLFWRNRPDAELVYKGVDVRTNAFGMRDDATTRRKPHGTYRILSLGESTTFGSKVAQSDTYSAKLEDCLDERDGERDVEVLNIGTPGWSLVQSYVWLEREGLGFDPDMVIVYHGYNDFLGTSFVARRVEGTGDDAEASGTTDLALAMRPRGTMERVGEWLNANSRAFRVIGHRMRQMAQDAKSEAPKTNVDEAMASGDDDGVRVPEEDRREVLGRMARLAEQHDFELVILVPCYREFDEHRALLFEVADAENVAIIDLEAAVEALGGARDDHFADASHPGARLHAEFAALLCEKLGARIASDVRGS